VGHGSARHDGGAQIRRCGPLTGKKGAIANRGRFGPEETKTGARFGTTIVTFSLLSGKEVGGHVDLVAKDDEELLAGWRRQGLREQRTAQ